MPETRLITGSTIGCALARLYASEHPEATIYLTWHSQPPPMTGENIRLVQLDATDEDAVARLCGQFTQLDTIIVTTGFLHDDEIRPEKTIRRSSAVHLQRNIERNTLPTLLLAKHTLDLVKKSPAPVFAAISAKVGSITDNGLGGWYSYRASKAALNMLLKSLALEWQHAVPRGSVAALHPGTVESPLSAPFSGRAPRRFSPDEGAACLKRNLDALTPETSGRFWDWRGDVLPW